MTAVIDTLSGTKLIGTLSPFILLLKRDEEITESIINTADAAKIGAASISGLGALEDPTIAYYNLQTQTYQKKTFPGIFELTSLNGNIAKTEEGKTIAHIHVTLADDQHRVIGGHLVSGKVGVVAEITFIPLNGTIIRKYDATLGLKIISP